MDRSGILQTRHPTDTTMIAVAMTAGAMDSCTRPPIRPNDGVGSFKWVPAPDPAAPFSKKLLTSAERYYTEKLD